MKLQHFLFPLLLALSGCADRMENPYLYDKITYPDRAEVGKENRDQIIKVSYIARNLMESDNRAEIVGKVTNSDVYNNWGAPAEAGVMAQMSTDLAVGEFSSSAGADIGAAVFGAGLVLGEIFDGSREFASTAWLPESFNGDVLKTKEQATKALYELTRLQIQRIADTMNWQVECIYGCTGSDRVVYYFTNPNNHPLHPDYVYKPVDFAIQVAFNPLTEVKSDDPVSALLDEPIQWQTNGHHSYSTRVYGGVILDDSENPVFIVSEKDGEQYLRISTDMTDTHMGRDIMRTFHRSPYTFYGNSDDYPHVIYYEGVAYTFAGNSNTYLASDYLDEPYLLDGKAPVITTPEFQTAVTLSKTGVGR